MYENKQQQQTAVLAAVDTGEYDVQRSVDELEELAKSAGAEVLGRMIQRKDRPDPKRAKEPSEKTQARA